MKSSKILLLLLLLSASALSRPLLEYEMFDARACHKGQLDRKFIGQLPSNILEWGYERPELIEWPLSYRNWEKEYRRYFKSHYGDSSLFFRPKPSMIVMHYTVVPTAELTYTVLQRNHVSVQLMIAKDGSIYQLMPLNRRCNGAYGVNHKALSIEMVASDDRDLLSRPYQIYQSFCLVKYLMAKYDISLDKVVGHYEVGQGVTVVPDYLDLADPYYPTSYPPSSARFDPGKKYMRWLRAYLEYNPPTEADL